VSRSYGVLGLAATTYAKLAMRISAAWMSLKRNPQS
jgi:hypothetical protein